MRQTDQTAQAYGSLIKCNIVLTLRRGTDGVFAHKDGAFAGKACALFLFAFSLSFVIIWLEHGTETTESERWYCNERCYEALVHALKILVP